MVATSALIAMAIMGGAEVAKTGIEAHAASTAADKQQQGANNALNVLGNIWGQEKTMAQPYVDVGTGANDMMNQFMSRPASPYQPFNPWSGAMAPGAPVMPPPRPVVPTQPGPPQPYGRPNAGIMDARRQLGY